MIKIAVIGSFRQFYTQVTSALRVFSQARVEVTTPKGTPILEAGIPFVRFESDERTWSNEKVQVVALHRILRADLVFAVVPGGYVGRTTCYEIGRVIQAKRPLYFSERPEDLPILVPESHVATAEEISGRIRDGSFVPAPLQTTLTGDLAELELDLVSGRYREI